MRTKNTPSKDETQAAEAATIAWMLTVMATLAAELAALGMAAFVWLAPYPDQTPERLKMVPALMLFIAAVTGVICLILTPVVLRQRRVAPPRSVTTFAVLAGVSPIVALVVLYAVPLAG